MMTQSSYKIAGVDIDAGNEAVRRIKTKVESTFNSSVLTSIGGFGALFDLKTVINEYHHPLLVQSIDGVGTKMMVAKLMQRYHTIGIDLVSAATNDIVVIGAKPLTFLDYIANDQLKPEVIDQIVTGMVDACRENEIALVGGETAEMPGTYLPGEHDLVGVITGVVEKEEAILGNHIEPGDVVLGLGSSGLHTNGYSLARHLFFEVAGLHVHTHLTGLNDTLGEVLLTPHINYNNPIQAVLKKKLPIKGMAHITGGGLFENIPRILPNTCAVEIYKNTWAIPPIFTIMQTIGKLKEEELYRTFNMGIGLIMILDSAVVYEVQQCLKKYRHFQTYQIGRVIRRQPMSDNAGVKLI